ncbi:hypothetical protein [Methyloraptor flagellatus]|jgi:uncharacterized protein YjiS (DUF1127 family)|uniref:DUF1127 domain-containing protein n=1 Tax=Methyloraptor flagellatus TaxID=3162530 RepID=A0AAU7XBX3_9HYPH
MRDAALEITRQAEGFGPSIAMGFVLDTRTAFRAVVRTLAAAWGRMRRQRRLRGAPLDAADARLLDDLGLRPGGRPDPSDPYVSVLLAATRGRRDEERWRFD